MDVFLVQHLLPIVHTVVNCGYGIILYERGMILNHESGVSSNIDHFEEHFFITKIKVVL